ncbi:hypothetical protein BBK82_07035 [Lentzea guizhouensis]|uniref:Uncharacterized protein n=1 Tax=Lentzea guizhouensis TaxID=1586287 RepID=A0A1B2HDR5_9PSEU|nr:hypothetical protein BBK82_07035 [Lentzea guizhouensis]
MSLARDLLPHERHDHGFMFAAEGGTWLWRSTFIRRVLKPAVNGNQDACELALVPCRFDRA